MSEKLDHRPVANEPTTSMTKPCLDTLDDFYSDALAVFKLNLISRMLYYCDLVLSTITLSKLIRNTLTSKSPKQFSHHCRAFRTVFLKNIKKLKFYCIFWQNFTKI
jgi:hypothetical protein